MLVKLDERIKAEIDTDVLNDWLMKALTVSTTDEFADMIFSK